MKRVDILIVGGGPAGSSLAWSLRNSGLDIAVMDKQAFPRQKVCAGWVTPAVMRTLHIDTIDYAKSRVLQPITGFRISMIGQEPVQSHFDDGPVSYGIRRIEFDHYLLQRCGAELLLEQPFRSMEKTADGWCVNGEIDAKLVVGAGGHFCPVARAIGSKGVSELAVAAKEIEFEMTPEQAANCDIDREVPELFFTPDLKGYGWIFRKGDYLNIGLGREDKSKLGAHVASFCDYLKQTGRIRFDLTEKFNGHAYLLYPHAKRKVIDDRVLLIGDSVGLAYAQSGEGIRPAVESAVLAAEVLEGCNGDYDADRLKAYEAALQERFGEREPAPDLLERLPAGVKRFAARGLMKTEWFTKKIVTEKWFLQAQQDVLDKAG